MADPDGLKDLGGPAAWFISMMASAIIALAAAVGLQWKHANKVYGYRLSERDTLNAALVGAAKSQDASTRAQEEQNRVTEELADAMRSLANAFERLNERLAMQFDHGKDHARDQLGRIDDNTKAIGSLAEALRVNTGIVTDIRNNLSKQGVI
jgi:hypothetical protein